METVKTAWAILLTRFNDDKAEPYRRERSAEIFTASGSGKWNMVDYFRDVSHGKLDLTGSKVFGWYDRSPLGLRGFLRIHCVL
jgi:hypothetical protein